MVRHALSLSWAYLLQVPVLAQWDWPADTPSNVQSIPRFILRERSLSGWDFDDKLSITA